MAKINLLNKIIKQQNKKRLAKNSVWVIACEQNDKEYFVISADKEGFAVVWTDNKNKAMRFHTEKGCQHFVQTFMKGRIGIRLQWIEDEQQ